MLTKQTEPRAVELEPNDNISFPIGTALVVKDYFKKLKLQTVFNKFKSKGNDLSSLIQSMVTYRLTENQSVTQASDWINRKEVLETFKLKEFEQRTLYRVLEILGMNREEIMLCIQDRLFETYQFEHTNINMDWTSLILFGDKCPIGKRGYSRDHRPDKKQITLGVSELANPINVPIGMTVREGNINDQVHFTDTYDQVKNRLKPGSILVFDQGANRKLNIDRIEYDRLKYVTARQINMSDEKKWIRKFDKRRTELVDERYGVYGLKKKFPSRINYLFYSEKLYHDQIESKLRKVEKLFKEAEVIQASIDNDRRLPKRYRINNPLVDCEYTYQTKLSMMSEEEAKEVLRRASITGREGFFCLVSNMDLTLNEVLSLYRQKDSIEKLFNSLKNEIDIRPLRVWSEYSIYGALLIGFLSQLFMSLVRYEHAQLKHTSVKFIRVSLMNLTVTVEKEIPGVRRHVFSNFDWISTLILCKNRTET